MAAGVSAVWVKKILILWLSAIAVAANLAVPVDAQQAQGLVLEVVFFQSKPGVSNQQLLAAAEKINPALNSMPGFVSRSVGHGQEHQWVDVVYWQSMSDAVHAAQRITSVPAMQNFESLMIHHTVRMYHFTIENQETIK